MAREGWTRSLTSGRLLAPHHADVKAARAERARIAEQARVARNARPMTEEEIAALVASYPSEAVKKCPPGEEPEQRLRWPAPPRKFGI